LSYFIVPPDLVG